MNVKILTLTISFMWLTFVKAHYGQPYTRYPKPGINALTIRPYTRFGNEFNGFKQRISHLNPLNKSRFLQRYKAHFQDNKANNDRPIFLILYPGPPGRGIGSGRPQEYYENDPQNSRTTQRPYNPVDDVDKNNTNEEDSIIFPNDEEKYNRDYNGIDVRSN
ncbi:hypothetical protein RR48_09320 [Papilio machaon]|uniref:Uncharacterized protein n=1 Tax=Papilio machaon TaxID=76193 RepID=A0A194RBS9_PAPMA|nr:hypothetical protein RR48_09320 [Papilio machaon]